MTTENITTTDEGQNGNNKPNFYAKVRHGFGKKASYERIGAAWLTEDGCDLREACRQAGRRSGLHPLRGGGQRQGGSVAPAARRPIARERGVDHRSAPRFLSRP